jgi:A/G-specific adenine glycosylase
LWQLAEDHLPESRSADYSQASMDLGALLCLPKSPNCTACPVQSNCKALALGEQEDFPEKKKPVKAPQRHCVLILMVDDKDCLLMEKRPPSGIWGGLWSLPMFDSIEQAEASMGRLEHRRFVAPLVHVFTHFRLHAGPIVSRYNTSNTRIQDSEDGRWVNAATAITLGMPKPIRILVANFFAGQLEWQEPSTV